jgi:hypothetical protein
LSSCNSNKSTNISNEPSLISEESAKISEFYQNGQEKCWESENEMNDTTFYQFDDLHRIEYAFIDTLNYFIEKPAYMIYKYNAASLLSSVIAITYNNELGEVDSIVSIESYEYSQNGKLATKEISTVVGDSKIPLSNQIYVELSDGRIAEYSFQNGIDETLYSDTTACYKIRTYNDKGVLQHLKSCDSGNPTYSYDFAGNLLEQYFMGELRTTWSNTYNSNDNLITSVSSNSDASPTEIVMNWSADCPTIDIPEAVLNFELPVFQVPTGKRAVN